MAVASAPNQYAQYQWKDDPARRVAGQIATAKPPSFGAQNVAQGAQPTQSDAVTGASPWAPAKSSPFTIPGATPVNPGSFSQMLAKAQAPREANLAAANTTISQMLAPQTEPSAEGQRALSDLDKQQAEQARQLKEQSALSGRLATGQSVGDSLRLSERLMTNRADAAGQVAAADAERNNQRQQQGFNQFMGMEQLGEQSRATQTQADLARAAMAQSERFKQIDVAQADKQLAQQASQSASQQDFTREMTRLGYDQEAINRAWQSAEAEKGRAFTAGENALNRQFTAGESALDRALNASQFAENIGLNKQQIAETIRQFDSKQAFDKWATQAGLDDAEKARLWNATEADKQRAYDSGERQLDRALSSSQFAEKLGLDKAQLSEQIRQFDSREAFDTWAKKLDVSQAEADRIWKSNQDDIMRKWQSGERLSSQEHEVAMQGLQEKADIAKMERNQVLNLQTMEQQNAYDQMMLGQKAMYDDLRMRQEFSHEESMAKMQSALQSELMRQGYTQDQALQASRLEADRIENERNRAFQDKIEFARLAQENSQFLSQFGLDKQRVQMQSDQIKASIANEAERLGMDKETFEAAMQDAAFAKNIETAAIMAEKFGDSPEMLEKSTDLIWEGLYKGGLVSKEEYDAGKLASKAASFKDPTEFKKYAASIGANPAVVDEILKAGSTGSLSPAVDAGSKGAIQAAKDQILTMQDSLPYTANVDKISALVDNFGQLKAGSGLTGSVFNSMQSLPGANAALGFQYTPTTGQQKYFAKTQEGADYFSFASLVNAGLTEKQAYQVAEKAIGADRMKKAYKALTGKDWAG